MRHTCEWGVRVLGVRTPLFVFVRKGEAVRGLRLVRVMGIVAVFAGVLCVWRGVHWTPSGLEEAAGGGVQVPSAVTSADPHPVPTGPAPRRVSRSDGRVWVSVPAVGVDAPVAGVLHRRGGAWWPPSGGLGMSASGAGLKAGVGTSMLAGHVWEGSAPGVFYHLHQVRPGMIVGVADGHERLSRFVVTDVRQVPSDLLPEWVWGSDSGQRRLVLVTCAGRSTGGDGSRKWSQNLIVTAREIR